MKLSISLSEEEVAVLDAYAKEAGLSSRSAAVQHAVRMLRHPGLEDDYAAAWAEWRASGEETAWEGTSADGLDDAAR
ncbi:ribbon-helix-helix domain-containing protein [Geodermatophilus sp. SYSU D01180]